MAEITVPTLPITDCPAGAGSINDPSNPGGGLPTLPNPYVPPELCIGDFTLTEGECAAIENNYQESLAAENLNISQRTVHAHLQNAGEKLDATNKTQAVVEALRYGQISLAS